MSPTSVHRLVTLAIAAVWIGFGLFAKVLGLVPRHEEIVGRILGEAWAGPITVAIGAGEVLLGLWVASAVWSRLCAIVQIALLAGMNLLEIALAPDLLLWGPLNGLFAAALAGVVWFNQWVLGERAAR